MSEAENEKRDDLDSVEYCARMIAEMFPLSRYVSRLFQERVTRLANAIVKRVEERHDTRHLR